MANNRGRIPACNSAVNYNTISPISASCVKGNGRFYQGRKNVTKDGLECQKWFTNDPHPQTIPEGVFPEMATAASFCRNPGGTEPTPWCYTLDPGVRWQYCDIQMCGE